MNRKQPHVNRCVAMLHVADVESSAQFYGLLGFEIESRYVRDDGVTNFIGMRRDQAELFLACASGPIESSQQAVLFYMYTANVTAMREHLIANGIADGGVPPGMRKHAALDDAPDRHAVFSICYPFYMPNGELRVHDLDGYVLLIGQLAP